MKMILIVFDVIVLAAVVGALCLVACKYQSVKKLMGGVKLMYSLANNDMEYLRSLEQYQNRLTYRAYPLGTDSIRRVVVLGNSITRHAVREEVGWLSDYGMAASSLEADFCHVLQQELRTRYPDAVVVPKNIAAWERDFSVDKDSLMGDVIDSADVVIIRLGENIPSSAVPQMDDAIRSLVGYVRERSGARVVITGCFWLSLTKDAMLRRAAASLDLPYVSLSFADHPSNKALSGGEATDTLGNVYHFDGAFVGSHPNDRGMKAIADALLPLFMN